MYYKLTKDGYITVIGTGDGGTQIATEEYENILDILRNKPTARSGYEYRLKEDLTWDLVEVSAVDPDACEIYGSELLDMIEGVL